MSRDGSIDWLCFPRFDSPSVFGRILDDAAGHWSISPAGGTPFETTRRYVDDTLLLETTFTTADGSVTMTDAMAVGRNERGHDLGAGAVGTVLRRLVGVEGRGRARARCTRRGPSTGSSHRRSTRRRTGSPPGEGPACCGCRHRCRSSSTAPPPGPGSPLRAGETLSFALHHRTTSQPRPRAWTQAKIGERLDDTAEAWRTWSSLHQSYDGPWADLVRTSGRVLYGLTYFPTGAIVAAPTTSLPEAPGGSRNWDYRYTWVRDASFTLEALWVAACPHEANKFFDYLADAAAAHVAGGGDLQIMFGIGGEHDLTERELGHLSGWRTAARAHRQRRVEPTAARRVRRAARRRPPSARPARPRSTPSRRRFLADLADIAAARWWEADQGIWEVRGEPRHFLYSKLMCWVALDRAIALADRLDARDRVDGGRSAGTRSPTRS